MASSAINIDPDGQPKSTCPPIGHQEVKLMAGDYPTTSIHRPNDPDEKAPATVSSSKKPKLTVINHCFHTPALRRDPLIYVRLLGKMYPAVLDTGSNISILGTETVNLVKQSGVELYESQSSVSFVVGKPVNILNCANLILTWHTGIESEVHFFLVPGFKVPILLGRDFIVENHIIICLQNMSWALNSSPTDYFPFHVHGQGQGQTNQPRRKRRTKRKWTHKKRIAQK